MANSLTLSQKFIAQALVPVQLQFPDAYIIHNMYDILLASSEESQLHIIFDNIHHVLVALGLCIATEKFKSKPPIRM
jgi:hypothetical protein